MDPSFFASQKQPNSWELSQFNINGEVLDGVELQHVLFRGGYLDFIPYPEELEEIHQECRNWPQSNLYFGGYLLLLYTPRGPAGEP